MTEEERKAFFINKMQALRKDLLELTHDPSVGRILVLVAVFFLDLGIQDAKDGRL